jgi:diaminohydroxyphosphoribosylaminopyrimidine deaminase / 5-amino-6-(5-phosphoribosylamino)uracil reductase
MHHAPRVTIKMKETTDDTLMRRALELARKGTGYVSPNPLVGCVITDRAETIIGEGAHLIFGGPHAEPNAIADAEANGHSVEGATVYVTLEPHCHQGKTTPCSRLLVEKKIARCVIAMQDPYPLVNGGGIRELREAGIEVEVGICESEARELNRFFIKHRTTHLPYVTLKLASSLDGRSALSSGESHWITSEASRKLVHGLRAEHDAVLIGARTAQIDDPALTVRLVEGRQPWRIVLDARLDLALSLQLFSDAHRAKTILVTDSKTFDREKKKVSEVQALGVEVLPIPAQNDRIDLHALFTELGKRGLSSVLVEAGPTLASSMIASEFFDEIQLFVAPLVLGGDAKPSVGPLAIPSLDTHSRYCLHSASMVGDSGDLLLRIRRAN